MQLDSIEDYMDFPSHNLDMEKGMLGNVMNQQEEDNLLGQGYVSSWSPFFIMTSSRT